MSLKPYAVDFEKTWKQLKVSILKVVTLQPMEKKIWDNHFHDIYALCVAFPKDYGVELYEETKKCLQKHVESLHQDVVKSGDKLLETYYKCWTDYHKGSDYVDKLFRFLNNQVVKKQKYCEADLAYSGVSNDQIRTNMMEIGELALEMWRKFMITPLEKNMVPVILEEIDKDRRNVVVQNDIVRGVIQSFVDAEHYSLRGTMELYQNIFESKLLENTAVYYKKVANQLFEGSDCSRYMEKLLAQIKEEDLRSRKFLHPTSYEKVTTLCHDLLVTSHLEYLHSVTGDMVQKEKLTDLANVYALIKPLKFGLAVLVKEFENHVKKIALEFVQNLKGDQIHNQFVEGIFNVHRRFAEIISDVFRNDKEFIGALDQGCVTAVNYKESSKSCPKAPEWLAKYTDHLLRKSPKNLMENEMEDKLTSAVLVFRYIEDKDIFQKHYSRMLSQRLIYGVSVSMDAEELMVSKLKNACGYEFTSKFHRMFNDIKLSRELTNAFINSAESENEIIGLGFQIKVLQAGAWPLILSNPMSFNVPGELEKSISLFEKFYNNKFTGRKLTWLYNMAETEIQLNYLSRPYVATMSVYQATIVLHFNGQTSYTVEEIKDGTQLKGEILYKNLKSLIDCDLLKAMGDIQQNTTLVYLNTAFSSKLTKIKVSAPVMQKQAKKEAERVNATVQQDRRCLIECAVVRLMKTRKILKQTQLIDDVVGLMQGRFAPDVPFIRNVVDHLIEKQYLQRTQNSEEFSYLA